MTVRVNTRISSDMNDWLDERSKKVAISKSSLINIAIENYIKEVEVVYNLPKLVDEFKKMGIDLDNLK